MFDNFNNNSVNYIADLSQLPKFMVVVQNVSNVFTTLFENLISVVDPLILSNYRHFSVPIMQEINKIAARHVFYYHAEVSQTIFTLLGVHYARDNKVNVELPLDIERYLKAYDTQNEIN